MPKRVGYIYQRMEDPAFIRRCIRIGTRESKKKSGRMSAKSWSTRISI